MRQKNFFKNIFEKKLMLSEDLAPIVLVFQLTFYYNLNMNIANF